MAVRDDSVSHRQRGRRKGWRSLAASGILSIGSGVAIALAGAFPFVFSPIVASAAGGDVGSAGVFELDGNIAQDAATPPPFDWSCVFNNPAGHAGCPPSTNPAAGVPKFISSVFAADYQNPDPTYHKASDADIADVTTWGCVTLNNPTNKDDILNAYGAAFVPTTGPKANHLLIYLGQERASGLGDSNAGFWLMHSQHGCSGSGSFSGGGHDPGDLFVLSTFTNGGTSATVQLYEWDTSVTNNLRLVGSGLTCGGPGTTDVCGIANSGSTSITEPWAPNSPLSANQFLEIGIDATDVIPPPSPPTAASACFSNFISETRSSQQTTATLKDFAGGQLHFCVSPSVSTQQTAGSSTAASMTAEVGTAVTDQATLGAPLNGTPKGTVTYRLYSTSDCSGTAVFTSTKTLNPDGSVPPSDPSPTNLGVGTYQWQASYTGDTSLGGHNLPAVSACGDEPLTLIDANITITPQTATNGVGTQHVFTITASALPASVSLTSAAITTNVSPAPSTQSSTCGSPTISGNQATCTLTINSTSVATYTANAAATLVASGVTMKRSTDSSVIGSGPRGPGGSGPATKYYVDALIAITPGSAVNEVNHQHLFTITVTALPGADPATPSFTSITTSVTPAPSSQSSTCASPTVNGNTATCTLTINSTSAGDFTINAAATVTIGGAVLHRSTDGSSGPAGPGGSGPATKTFVDASITIGPSAINPVNNAHTFTIVVTAIPAGASPVSFDSITTSVSPTPGSQSNTCATPVITGNTATCTLTINSALPSNFQANASANVTMGGVTVVRATNGNSGPGGSGPATKTFVDASIAISPTSSVNEVGHQHVFTVTVTAMPAGATPVVFNSIHTTVTPTPGTFTTTCGSPVINGNVATCTVTINNATAGTFTINASAVVTMGGTAVNRSTDGTAGPSGPGGSGPATKTFVDASVVIGPPTATNVVGAPHTFTITVTAISGGATPISFGTITPSVTPTPSSMSTTCGSPTINGAQATCTVTINSTVATTYTANVSADVTMGGVTVTRSTTGNSGPGGSGPATKIYELATITIAPTAVNEVGHQHVFTITVTSLPGQTTTFNSITPHVTPTPGTMSSTCGSPTINANVATCTVTINSSTAGVFTATATAVLTINGFQTSITTDGQNGDSGAATKTYVDASIAITPSTAVNEVGNQHVFTVTVTAFPPSVGSATFSSITTSVVPTPGTLSTTCGSPNVSGMTATCTITINSATAGTFTANAVATLTVDGVVLHRSTDGSSGGSGPGGSGPAVKHYVDASVSIGPSAVNEVGNEHVFTIVVTAIPGGAAPVVFGTITPSVSPAPGTQSTTCGSPTISGNTATCTLTVDNSLAATFAANVSASVTMGGVTVTRSTNGNAGPGGSGPATKTYVDASIAISASSVNEVNHQHVFTITVTAIPSVATPVVFNSITPSVSPTPDVTNSSTCGSPVVSGNVATCTVTVDNSTAGTFTVNARAVVTMGGTSVSRSTDGSAGPAGPGGSGPSTKTFVDASVAIGPQTATNVVGAQHVFTVTVTAFPRGASPVSFGAITPSVVPSPTTMTSTCGTPTLGPGNTATCTVTITSNVVATYTANVSADVTMGGVTVTRSTSGNSGPGGSGPATKIYGRATITIAPTAVNEVGHQHVFTITVTSLPGQTTTFDSITPHVTPTPGTMSSTCGSPTINGNVATCTVTVNSSTAGVFTASATAVLTINGFQVTVTTDGQNGDSGPATKTFVDALIAITPATAVNEVGNQHVFTVTVTALPASVGGATFSSITTSVTPTPGTMSSTCGNPTVSGMTATCTITINSPTAGTFTANAAAVLTVAGVVLHRSTDGSAGVSGPGGSGPAVKHYVDASIAVTPATAVNEVNHQHIFTVTVTAIPGGATPVSFGAITTSVSPTPDTSSTTCATPSISGNVATCTITIDNATANTFTVDAGAQVTMGGVTVSRSTTGNSGPGGSASAVKHFVDASVAITPASAVNEVGNQHVFTVTVTAIPSGATPVDFTSITTSVTPTPGTSSTTCGSPTITGDVATCTITIDSTSAGTFTANVAAVVTIGGVVLDRSTDGSAGPAGPGGSGPAVKNYVDASVGIGPSAFNEINHQHVFDIVVTAYPAGATPVSFDSITPSVSPKVLSMSTTCGSPTVNANQATCTLTINNDLPATFTANVTAQVTMGGVTVTRSTSGNSGPGGTGPATKTYVTANIGLSPLTADDPVGDHHVLTATVTVDDGSGAGPVPAPDGTVVDVSIVSGPGTLASPSCTTSGGAGTCTDTLTSNVAGTTVIHASTTVVVKGVTLHRATNDSVPGDSIDATKNWHKVQPLIATTQSAGGTMPLAISDTGKVTGGLDPTGTVTFQLFGPTDTSCSAAPVFTSANKALTNGTATSDSFTPTVAGTYHWVATYNGDAGNLTAVSGCGDEPVTLVAAAPQPVVHLPNTGARIAWTLGLGLILAGLALGGLSWRRRREGPAES